MTDRILTAKAAVDALQAAGDPVRAASVARFFKTGKDEYGEGDMFLGLTVPALRRLVRSCDLPLKEIEKLLRSPLHEARTLALMAMVRAFGKSSAEERGAIFESYLSHTSHINSWDLVDGSAEHIVGPIIEAWPLKKRHELLDRLARSQLLWERRIAVLATFHFIKRGDPTEALRLSKMLLYDKQDLIHKATGWMLREIGKRCDIEALETFLDAHSHVMPRTMLRYSIERLPPSRRAHYLAQKLNR